eukprot:SAG31_NODE_3945_length_3729_cov_4.246832_6_plen_137_part_00
MDYSDGLAKLRAQASAAGKLLVLGIFGPAAGAEGEEGDGGEEGDTMAAAAAAAALAALRALAAADDPGGSVEFGLHIVPRGQRLSPVTEALGEELFAHVDPIDKVRRRASSLLPPSWSAPIPCPDSVLPSLCAGHV